MRIWVLILVVVLSGPRANADPPASPRIAKLTRATEDAFWKQVAVEGTPLIEDVKDPKGRLLVTFLYRGQPDTKHVAMYASNAAYYRKLERVAGTNTFAVSDLFDPTARFTYWLAPGDDFGPPAGGSDFPKRQPLFQPDMFNKRPYAVRASLAELPLAPKPPWLAPRRGTAAGELHPYTAKSRALNNERQIIVYTPPSFAPRGTPYPLVVVFDGPDAVTLLAMPIVLDELIAAHKIPPVVVLFVGNADRGKELPPNPAFADFVALDLVPWVRRDYHATSDPRMTVVAGISYGGIAAAFAAGRHPAVYGNVLSQSGTFSWSPDADVEGEVVPHDFATRPRMPIRFWMSCGTLEGGPPIKAATQLGANRHMRDVLAARGYEVEYHELVGAHEYQQWRINIADGLIALLSKPPRPDAKAGASPGQAGGVELVASPTKPIIAQTLRAALADGGAAAVALLKTLGADFNTGEHEVNQAGYSLLELARPRDAIAVFEWNVERFPTSGNAFDSLGEAYYQAGDRGRAVTSYKRSLELDPKNDNARHMIKLLR